MKNPTTRILRGDCLQVLKKFPDSSVDSIVTDPPAGISFMGKSWDDDKGHKDLWIHWLSKVMKEAKRVLKPGGHGLVWAIPRTSHWTGNALETAGFEIRDVITHLFGQGFPKSLDISKAIDKEMGAESNRPISHKNVSCRKAQVGPNGWNNAKRPEFKTKGATPEAKQWEGWGTALKPACEFWFLIRKPIEEKTVAKNVLKHSTGALNIDECRIGTETRTYSINGNIKSGNFGNKANQPASERAHATAQGRFPSNLVFSHTEECKLVGLKEVKTSTLLKTHTLNESDNKAMTGKNYQRNPKKDYGQNGLESVEHWECSPNCAVKTLDDQVSRSMKMHGAGAKREVGQATQDSSGGLFGVGNHEGNGVRFGDSGGASRFFYCAKISSSERNWGLNGMKKKPSGEFTGDGRGRQTEHTPQANHHPTVKAVQLMRYLCKLITPPNGIVLDPFMGSGSTGLAALREGFGFVGIEKDPEYFQIASERIKQTKQLVDLKNEKSEKKKERLKKVFKINEIKAT